MSQPSQSFCVLSCSAETSSPGVRLDLLLKQIVSDILVRPLSFDNVTAAVISKTRDSGRESCIISSIGPSSAPFSLVTRPVRRAFLQHVTARSPPNRSHGQTGLGHGLQGA